MDISVLIIQSQWARGAAGCTFLTTACASCPPHLAASACKAWKQPRRRPPQQARRRGARWTSKCVMLGYANPGVAYACAYM